MSLPPSLSDGFFYTDRVEIERAGCRVQRFKAQQQQPAASINRPPLHCTAAAAAVCPYIQYVVVLKFVTGYDVREQISPRRNKLRM